MRIRRATHKDDGGRASRATRRARGRPARRGSARAAVRGLRGPALAPRPGAGVVAARRCDPPARRADLARRRDLRDHPARDRGLRGRVRDAAARAPARAPPRRAGGRRGSRCSCSSAIGILVGVLVIGGIISQADDISANGSSAADEIQGWLEDAGVDSSGAESASSTAKEDVPRSSRRSSTASSPASAA